MGSNLKGFYFSYALKILLSGKKIMNKYKDFGSVVYKKWSNLRLNEYFWI